MEKSERRKRGGEKAEVETGEPEWGRGGEKKKILISQKQKKKEMRCCALSKAKEKKDVKKFAACTKRNSQVEPKSI